MASPLYSSVTDDHLAHRTAAVDELVLRAFSDHIAASFPRGLALVAVGGYGRGELFPHSDVDLLILVEKPLEEPQRIAAFLRTLWDQGLRLSHSVHTVAECCQLDDQNIELSISVLDQRLVCGDAALHKRLSAAVHQFVHTKRKPLMARLAELTRARHAKYQHTIFHLEPNVKEAPGGVRDIHVVRWLGRLRGTDLTPPAEIEPLRRFAFGVRRFLHEHYGRDTNVLSFEVQQKVSSHPGEWMRSYFLNARAIYRLTARELEITDALTENQLVRQFRDWRSRLSNAEFTVSRERVFFRAPQALGRNLGLVLRLFQFVGRHGIRPAVETYRRIAEHLPQLRAEASREPRLWVPLRDILSQPHASLALHAMHESGLMATLFPEWQAIDCLVVPDAYHRYTVDEHSLRAIEVVSLLGSVVDEPAKRFSLLLSEVDDLPSLLLALLFHDTGKSRGFDSHVDASIDMARTAFERIGVPEEHSRFALSLIANHLELSAAMNRDMDDPATVAKVARQVGTIEQLKALTLLTYADIGAVNPSAMTAWRAERLWRVYLRTYRELTRELQADRIVPGEAGNAPFLTGLPTRYLRMHGSEQIAEHIRLEQISREAGVAVDLQKREGGYGLTVVTADRPGLLAALAGTLAALGMNILKAEAFGNYNGTVIDTFTFADPMRTLELNPTEADRLKQIVSRVVLGREDVRKLLRGRSRPVRVHAPAQFEPSLAFDSTASASATLVEIIAEDRPGLLYELATAFAGSGCNIELVLIDTEAHKALDVFYVTAGGTKLDATAESKLRTLLWNIIAG